MRRRGSARRADGWRGGAILVNYPMNDALVDSETSQRSAVLAGRVRENQRSACEEREGMKKKEDEYEEI